MDDVKLANKGFIVVLSKDAISNDDLMMWQYKDQEARGWCKNNLWERFGDGLHYSKIEKLMNNAIGAPGYAYGHRIFINTQNPSVFDRLYYSSAEDVRSRILLADDVDFKFLTNEQAEEVWRSWEAGIQYVSEIFRTQGLW